MQAEELSNRRCHMLGGLRQATCILKALIIRANRQEVKWVTWKLFKLEMEK